MIKNFVNTDNTNSRPTGDYSKIISKISQDGVCPFCEENLNKYHKLPLEQKKYWVVTDNMYPYQPNLNHKLIIHRSHVSHLSEVSEVAWTELQEIFNGEVKKRNIVGGTLIVRFGETKYTGASVSHLHAHIVQSNPDDSTYDKSKGLTMRIG